jgi:cytochrome b6-f complex iron-sulfur subunit
MEKNQTPSETERKGWLRTWLSRRDLLRRLGWSGIGIFSLSSMVGTCRLFYPRTLFEPPSRFKAGFPDEFQPGAISTAFQEQYGVWIGRRSDGRFFAIKAECTHLGCTPTWLESQNKFKCPCHGSGFRMSGVNFEGPAPRPLDRIQIRLAADGQLEVDKGVIYRGIADEDPDQLYPQSLLAVSVDPNLPEIEPESVASRHVP